MEFLPILGVYDTSAAQQSVVAIVWFYSSWWAIHFQWDRSGLQAGQLSTRTLCLCSHAVVTHAERGLALSCWNRHGVPGKSRRLDGSICPSKISNISLRINGTFTYLQITHAVGTDAPPCHHRGWLLHFSFVTVWMVFFSLWHVESDIRFSRSISDNAQRILRKIIKCLPLCIL